jgi:hypothetical protein
MDPRLETVVAALIEAVAEGSVTLERARELVGEMVLDGFVGSSAPDSRVGWHAGLSELGISDHALVAARDALQRRASVDDSRAAGARASQELDAVVTHARVLGESSTWDAPVEYASSALAVMDSVWSIGVRYQGVLNVLDRYRRLREAQGANAEHDTPAELIRVIEEQGGPEAFADAVQNRQRTSSKSGILKAEAVLREARHLREEGIGFPEDLVRADAEKLDALRARWVSVPGQGSGLSLDYFLMLSGLPGVKADRMVRRFVATALGLPNELAISAQDAGALVREAADFFDVDERVLDYAIWRFESGQ